MTDTIDAILYINLAHRQDRNASLVANLKRYNFDMEKVHRIDATLYEMCGHIGCAMSHIKALKYAIEKGWGTVLILEDDFAFNKSREYIHQKLKDVASVDYAVVLLAEGHKKTAPSEYPYLVKAISCTTTSAYLIKKHFLPTLLENFESALKTMEKEFETHRLKYTSQRKPVPKLNVCSAIDQYWFSLQQSHNFYLMQPVLGEQNYDFYSDNNCTMEFQKKKVMMYHQATGKNKNYSF
jgi:GR25 family glycosyltransferase involved in LPS biosynthesis